MNYDIPESVSQGSYGAYDEENRRIHEVADELRRRSKLYETQLRDSQDDVNHLDIEQRVAEHYAKEKGMWIAMGDIFDLGEPGPSGNENDTYVSNNIIYKVNNLLNSGSILRLLEKVLFHNILFPNTCYVLYAFTGFEGRSIMPVLQQRLVTDAMPATSIEIDTYMAALGFTKINNEGRYSNSDYEVWDIVPRNVLRDKDGDMYIIDAEIAKKQKLYYPSKNWPTFSSEKSMKNTEGVPRGRGLEAPESACLLSISFR